MTTTFTLNEAPLDYGSFIGADGMQHPASVLDLWSDQDLETIGVARVVTLPTLAQIKASLKASVDRRAEIERGRYITPGAGQAMTYQAKAAEAQHYTETDGAGDYPLLTAEVGVTGATIADVAAVVLGMHGQWQLIGAQIERARLSAKAVIDAAEDEAAARAVVPDWPAP
ncbi:MULTISPECIES: hypothetical protein [unclassified Chelatococcus]|uniref:hypothetical protein n=1 Tax=unclassified Chelatococcus TaxID=2638111 RepID=UPI001BCCCEE1|nr:MULTISPECIES: hypothetical protein [unclassified Chelatococcus]MBS7699152.1 hypothetical protein [Chelatococcus sp. YT9]MBX3554933.1 hypothetical protein [Chelatococcus sp.]